MIELRTLGSLGLNAPGRPDAHGLLQQPKRCAVLAYLTVSAPHGFVRRDTLLALFWPEADQARGRNALRQTIYQLRQFLGPDAIRSRGDEDISATPEVVSCDVTRFEALLADGRTAEALELYRGDFLTGFHVPDAAPELEEWMLSQARRLRALATTAAWSLARAEEQRGNAGGAAHWARRVLALDPLHETRVVDVMQLLARVGDRAGALHVYQEYARRAEAELGMAPAAAMQMLAQELRSAPANLPYNNVAESATTRSATAAPALPAPPVHRPRSLPPRARRLWWSLPAGALLVVSAVLWQRLHGPAREPVIAVGQITDPTRTPAESDVAADLLSTSLARLEGVHVISQARVTDVRAQLRAAGRAATSMLAAARELGADYLVEGSMQARDGELQLDLQLLDVRTGSVAPLSRAHGADLFGVIDRATTAIALAFDVRIPQERIAQVTTTSVVAYRLYDLGLQAYYEQDRPAANRLFRAALKEDSAFALAAYYAGLSTDHPPERHTLLQRALALAHRATDRERLRIAEGVAQAGMSATATALADTMAVRYPLDPDAQFAFGDALQRRGDFLAAARQYRRVITMDSLSLHGTARCLACDAYGSLVWAYLYADSANAAVRVWQEYVRVRPGLHAFATLDMVLARAGRFAEARRALRAADSVAPGNIDLELHAASLSLREGDFVTADSRLQRLLQQDNADVREQAVWYQVLSLRLQGRLRDALRVAQQHPNPLLRNIVLFEMSRTGEAAAGFEANIGFMDSTAPPGHRARHRAWSATHVATSLAAIGDTSRLRALADSVEQMGQHSAFGRDARLHHYIRGLLWNARRQPGRAADAFRASIWSWSEGYTRANYELARALLTLRKPAEAIYPLQAALRGDLQASNLYMSRTELHELLAHAFDQLGQRDSAAAHYRHVVHAWSGCDPALQARLDAARARLRAAN